MGSVIQVFDRQRKELFTEQVFGDALIQSCYTDKGMMRRMVRFPGVQRWLSRAVGVSQDSRLSKKLIPGFIDRYAIPMREYITPEGGFRSFNDFFIREFKEKLRPFPQDPLQMGSPAEGRLTVFPITDQGIQLTIKGTPAPLERLVGSPVIASQYIGGHAFVFRLCPVDYHRFHFPDDGRAGPSTPLGHELHSVNPVAQVKFPDVFLRNERQICLFESRNFGQLVLLEVGALCVGRIIQTYAPGAKIGRGQPKGYFAFGGSTTILLAAKDRLHPDPDLLEKTTQGIECLVRLGETIARAGLL